MVRQQLEIVKSLETSLQEARSSSEDLRQTHSEVKDLARRTARLEQMEKVESLEELVALRAGQKKLIATQEIYEDALARKIENELSPRSVGRFGRTPSPTTARRPVHATTTQLGHTQRLEEDLKSPLVANSLHHSGQGLGGLKAILSSPSRAVSGSGSHHGPTKALARSSGFPTKSPRPFTAALARARHLEDESGPRMGDVEQGARLLPRAHQLEEELMPWVVGAGATPSPNRSRDDLESRLQNWMKDNGLSQ